MELIGVVELMFFFNALYVFVFLFVPVFTVGIADTSVYTSRNTYQTAGYSFDQGEWIQIDANYF